MMVGTDPAKDSQSTTVSMAIVPLKFVFAEVITGPVAFGSTVTVAPGFVVGLVDFGYFTKTVMPQLFTNLGASIQPNMLPIFLGYNTFYTQNGGCCILASTARLART